MDLTRRALFTVTSAAAIGIAGAGRASAKPSSATNLAVPTVVPPSLPTGTVRYTASYQNWSRGISTAPVWNVVATSKDHLVRLVNWAATNGYRLRPTGFRHNWSPLTVAADANTDTKVILVDTRAVLTGISINTGSPASVTVGAGVSMDALLGALELRGLGLAQFPSPGDITVGGALAIGGHGSAIPAAGEQPATGTSYGSLSNLVLSIQAVVFDPAQNAYAIKEFQRDQVETAVLACHVGRALITQVKLRVGKPQRLRCVSRVDISVAELFAPAGSGGRTMESFLNQAGRVETIWFPFTETPWLKVWTRADWLPFGSRWAFGSYNYPFSDQLPQPILDLVTSIQRGNPSAAPSLGALQLSITTTGLLTSASRDIWGTTRATMLYVRPSTLRYEANGYAILCRRADVQRVLNETYVQFRQLRDSYRAAGRYPVNGPVEVRVTGLDRAGDSGVANAVEPWLSPTRPVAAHPEWDCAVWIDALTLPGTPSSADFFTEFERWLFTRYNGGDGLARPEWSKGWAYSAAGGWSEDQMLSSTIPNAVSQGQPSGTQFADAVTLLNRLDPNRVFSSPLLDRLLP